MGIVDLSRIGLEGIDTAHRNAESRALTDTTNYDLAAKKTNADTMRRLNELASGAIPKILNGQPGIAPEPSGEMGSLAEPLERFGRTYMEGGAPEQGAAFLKAASEIRKREQDIEDSTYTNHGKALDNMTKGADLVASTVGIARTQEDWDAGWATVEESGLVPPELVKLFRSMEFSPEAVEIVNEQSMSAKERADADRLASNARATERRDAATQADRLARQEIARGRLTLAEQAAERAVSTGAAATAPNKQEVDAAARAIEAQVFKGVSPTDPSLKDALKAGSSAVAARAKAIVRENRAISWDIALNRAVLESEAVGDWQPWVNVERLPIIGTEVSRTPLGAKYRPKGNSPDTALPMPSTKSKLVSGRFYDTPKGKARWTGTAFSTE